MHVDWKDLRELRKHWTRVFSQAVIGREKRKGVPHPDCSCGFQGPGGPTKCAVHSDNNIQHVEGASYYVWSSGLDAWEEIDPASCSPSPTHRPCLWYECHKLVKGRVVCLYRDETGRYIAVTASGSAARLYE